MIGAIFFTLVLVGSTAALAIMGWRERRAILAALFGPARIEARIEPRPLSADERATLRRALNRSVIVRKVLRRRA